MSRLLDALRQPEPERRSATAAPLALEPLHTGGTAAEGPSTTRPPRRPPPTGKEGWAPEPVSSQSPPPQRNLFRLVLIVILGGAIPAAIYIWWTDRPPSPLTPLQARLPAATEPPLLADRPSSPPASVATTASSPPLASPPRAPELAGAGQPTIERTIHSRSDDRGLALSDRAHPIRVATPRPATFLSPPAAQTHATAAQALQAAYAALAAGDETRAHTHYAQVLEWLPGNRDALKGLATLALRAGDRTAAAAHFRAVLATDPLDALARSQLLRLGPGEPSATEAAARSLLAAQPNTAAPYVLVGDQLARQARWDEARRAYVAAEAVSPGDPDVLFRLGISCEQLNQGAMARHYYLRAHETALDRPAGFAREVARERAEILARQAEWDAP